ncbi:hypothetical protein ES703_53566 [subsurface metagenome]
MKKGQGTWKFQELGKKLDQLAEKIRGRTQEEAEKAGAGIKEWGKELDELGEKTKKITQEGVEKVSGKTKGIIPYKFNPGFSLFWIRLNLRLELYHFLFCGGPW